MKNTYTYSQLGQYGALGNQLWQIAGVVGNAMRDQQLVHLPKWDYDPYFNVPEVFYNSVPGASGLKDFYPDYMQDLRHFEGYELIVRRMFKPSDGVLFEIDDLDLSHRTAVHVRRANNLNLPHHHPVPTLNYFEKALDMMDVEGLLVCSDDLEWCKKQSIFKDAMFGRGTPDGVNVMDLTSPTPFTNREAAIDLHMMARCKQHIIPNSTMSWWSAFIANSQKVIYPEAWFGTALTHIDTSVMFPKDWIKLSYE